MSQMLFSQIIFIFFNCNHLIWFSYCVKNMVPESSSDTEVNSLVSVVMSHVFFFQILERLKFEVTSEVEPEVHGVVEDLGKN